MPFRPHPGVRPDRDRTPLRAPLGRTRDGRECTPCRALSTVALPFLERSERFTDLIPMNRPTRWVIPYLIRTPAAGEVLEFKTAQRAYLRSPMDRAAPALLPSTGLLLDSRRVLTGLLKPG